MRRPGLLALLLLAALALAGCGGSSRPKGPPALVFVSTKDGDYAIFGSDAQGKHQYRLSKEKGDPSTPAGLFFENDPAWSPDGRKIAFDSRRDGVEHIYVMDWDGSGMRRLTDSSQEDLHPSWSPDGKRIVFSREGALFVMPAEGGTAHRIGAGLGNASDPAWSPDGRSIAYNYRQPGFQSHEVWVMRADGSGRHQLTNLGRTSGWPAWSPDSKRIAFHSNAQGVGFQIYVVGVDGKGLKRLVQADTDLIQPAWNEDGKRIAYVRDGAIWVDTPDREIQLTSGEDNDSAPAWRPSHRQ